MADQTLVDVLMQGADAFSRWRVDNPAASLNLEEARLDGAQLQSADLSRANLTKAHLARADLSDGRLSGALLMGTDLVDSDLRDAMMASVDLSGADLRGANLAGADLGGVDLTDVRFSATTVWPTGVSPPRVELIDLQDAGKVETHVEQAFGVAAVLAGEQEFVDAGTALRAALVVGRGRQGGAYATLRKLLPSIEVPAQVDPRPVNLGAISASPQLAAAYEYLTGDDRAQGIWGRDYVTLALLAHEHPSPAELAEEAGKTLQRLRDDWFDFVAFEDARHRNRVTWERWWGSAGIEAPTGTFLFAWERARKDFSDFADRATGADGDVSLLSWSTGEGKDKVWRGDDVYLMRQGPDPKGLVGAGRITGEVTEEAHWDPAARARGEKYHPVPVSWTALRETPWLTVDDLVEELGEEPLWTSAGGGRYVDRAVAARLDAAWRAALADTPTGDETTTDGAEPAGDRSETEEADDQTEPDATDETDESDGTDETAESDETDGTDDAQAGGGRTGPKPSPWVDNDAIVSVIEGEGGYRPSEHDSLDALAQAQVFSALFLARDVAPPFALGLLGDWGVGKTFFMRLMQEEITNAVGGIDPTADDGVSVSRVAQIEFNAWHYVDSDLWASLASHIFDGLSAELCDPVHEVTKIRRDLRRRIHSSQRERSEAEGAKEVADRDRRDAAAQLDRKRREREATAVKREKSRLAEVWKAVLRVKPGREGSDAANWPNLSEARDRAQAAAKRLGITDVIDSVEEAGRVHATLLDISRRGGGLVRSLGAAFTGPRRIAQSTAVVVALVGLVLAWPAFLDGIDRVMDIGGDELSSWLTPALRLGTVIGAGAVWAGRSLSSISSALRYLEMIGDEARHPRIEPEQSEAEQRLVAEIETLDDEIAKIELRIEAADRRIADAQAEIQRINGGGLVYDFLEGRVRDSRYLDRLGLISVIRKDFEELRRVLDDWAKHWRDADASHSETADPSQPETQPPSDRERRPQDTRPIDRIILYIDDLDRCPPERVVEVLQAVHLLLAFDLFVVVVAVDARWLERSLNEAYNAAAVGAVGSRLAARMHPFDAKNYLEKIFQIPFSLPAMDAKGYRDLVESLFRAPQRASDRTRRDGAETEPVQEGVVSAGEAAVDGSLDDDQQMTQEGVKAAAQPARPAIGADGDETVAEPTPADAQPDGSDAESDDLVTQPVDADGQPDAADTQPDVDAQPDERSGPRDAAAIGDPDAISVMHGAAGVMLSADLLERRRQATARVRATSLRDDEEQFITALHPFIGTPRLAKRFLNIYRLLRVRALDIETSFKEYLARDSGAYRATLVALAISIGRPGTAPDILEDLYRLKPANSLLAWLTDKADRYEDERDRLQAERADEYKRSNVAVPISESERRAGELAVAARHINLDLKLVQQSLLARKGPLFDDDLADYHRWAREAARYSFGWKPSGVQTPQRPPLAGDLEEAAGG